ncbi:MAG TPA: hypothetical protein VK034_31200 [Enhygromyxa sp.]|nr:hypothetical protein [Enhygromyxa sp.]
MTKTLLPLCAALLLFPATSLAAPASSDGSYINDEGARVTQNGEVREIVIDDGEAVDGELFKAMGEDLNGRPGLTHKNMISIRVNFLMQLTRLSADL